ncbi:MAG TPA: NAD(P)H-dependent glycerol-3-phosphate dehydrogenase, partial [Candidatus Acidoferrum sp.]|nr:NAD(P)H-dependent glycerol-3-phosphate dehydrogenase [Candidatus Acidoferrum sp.]
EISLWARSVELGENLQHQRENTAYLKGVRLADGIHVTHDISEALAGAHIVIGAMPSIHARTVFKRALPCITEEMVFVSATKGLEPETHLRMSLVLSQVLAKAATPEPSKRIAVLSGPSFAAEAARGEPTAVVLAAQDATLASTLQEELSGPSFRLYTNQDVLGVELAGAVKNVIAIAAGACQGLGLGSNPLAALITRGLAEMMRLAAALGARPETLSGLAGLGDLVLTCTGALSRNRHVGVELGKGRKLPEILAEMRMVAEGVDTAAPLLALAREHGIEMPITDQVDAILHRGQSPKDAIREIMDRPLKRE